MASLGIDVGDQSCFVGAAIGGGIEVLTNDLTERVTPSFVSFRANDRQFGSSARTQTIVNYKNTIFGIKNLLGRDFADPIVQHEIANVPFTVGQYPNSSLVGICVNSLGSDKWFTPTQIYSMLLRHIAKTAETTLDSKILSSVISVPDHYTDIQRRAVLDAAKLAGVPLQRLLNDGNAIALAYGLYKKDLPQDGDPARIVAFVDFGYTSCQINIFAFSDGNANCLSSVSCPNLGGKDFDNLLFEHFSAQFNQKNNVNIRKSKKSAIKLLAECEKLKKLLSVNLTSISINVECLMGDNDFTSCMNRGEFEILSEVLLERFEAMLREALLLSNIDLRNLFSVELVGGSSRLPAVARIVYEVFGKEVCRTLNFDESIAKGCAIQSTLLTPSMRVRQFHVVGVIPYSIRINWSDSDTRDIGEMTLYEAGSPANLTKILSFYKKSNFQIRCSYEEVNKSFHVNTLIAVFSIQNVKTSDNREEAKVKVKFGVDDSGILAVPNVELIESGIVEFAEVHEQILPCSTCENGTINGGSKQQGNENSKSSSHVTDRTSKDFADLTENFVIETTDFKHYITTNHDDISPANLTESHTKQENSLQKKFNTINHYIVLPVLTEARNMTRTEFEYAMNTEKILISQDHNQVEREYCKNELEEYFYDLRDKLEHSLSSFYTAHEKACIQSDLEEIEWLINTGTQEEPLVYKEHLNRLAQHGDQGHIRHREFQERPKAFKKLSDSLVRYRKFISEYNIVMDQCQHLETNEIIYMENIVNEKQIWLEKQLQLQHNICKCMNPQITADEILLVDRQLDDIIFPIISKEKTNN